MHDELKYIPYDDKTNYPFSRVQLVVETFGHSVYFTTNNKAVSYWLIYRVCI